jgi:putative acetyltransferase
LRESGHGRIVVLGHADHCPRFGFRPAAALAIRCQWDVPEPAFMVAELAPGALDGVSDLVRYEPELALV